MKEMSGLLSSVFISAFLMAEPLNAAAPLDPFATDDQVPKTRSKASLVGFEESVSKWSQSLSVMTYYQANDVNQAQAFNPNLIEFSDNEQLIALDYGAKYLLDDVASGLSARTRVLAQYEVQDSLSKNSQETDELKALEAYLNWHSQDYFWQAQLGRIKSEWGNGFNWNLTNLLRPYKDQPYSDQDALLQQEGWNTASLRYSQGPWFYQALVAELTDNDVTGVTYQPNQQYALRLGYQGGVDANMVVHKLPSQAVNYAVSVSQLLGDAITLRAQWSLKHQRDQQSSDVLANYASEGVDQADVSSWQQVLLGAAYTAQSGANYRLEYLYSEHGFSHNEWDYISNSADAANRNISNGIGSSADYAYITAALDSLNYAQLRQNYLYFMFTSPLSDGLWQYRQSVQLNLDDDSQLHRVELLKSWNANLTSRFQYETYLGCSDCEYGLNPNENTLRAVFKWDF